MDVQEKIILLSGSVAHICDVSAYGDKKIAALRSAAGREMAAVVVGA
jgi:hypothetical protein